MLNSNFKQKECKINLLQREIEGIRWSYKIDRFYIQMDSCFEIFSTSLQFMSSCFEQSSVQSRRNYGREGNILAPCTEMSWVSAVWKPGRRRISRVRLLFPPPGVRHRSSPFPGLDSERSNTAWISRLDYIGTHIPREPPPQYSPFARLALAPSDDVACTIIRRVKLRFKSSLEFCAIERAVEHNEVLISERQIFFFK